MQVCRRENVEVIKRFTGGGTVVVDNNTVISSIIANHQWIHGNNEEGELSGSAVNNGQEVPARPFQASSNMDSQGTESSSQTHSMSRISAWLVDNIYRKSGLFNSKFGLLDGDFVVESCDHTLVDRKESCNYSSIDKFTHYKVGGNAQACSSSAFVHHTSFLWSISPNISRLLVNPKRMPKYREERDHGDFLKSVRLGLSRDCKDSGEFANALRGMVDEYKLVEVGNYDHYGESRGEHIECIIINESILDEAIESMERPSTTVLNV